MSIITLKENNNKNLSTNISSVNAVKDTLLKNDNDDETNSSVKRTTKEQELSPNKSSLNIQTNFSKSILVRKNYDDLDDFMEVRVAVVGNVDAGKSTLLGVLTHGVLGDYMILNLYV